ncbi:hypothetical protein B0H12DRAFT_188751 [Mycena haematopus]|nr:hypothetical protein B0H12DRAFT_188751 [Mycena haematopus]
MEFAILVTGVAGGIIHAFFLSLRPCLAPDLTNPIFWSFSMDLHPIQVIIASRTSAPPPILESIPTVANVHPKISTAVVRFSSPPIKVKHYYCLSAGGLSRRLCDGVHPISLDARAGKRLRASKLETSTTILECR